MPFFSGRYKPGHDPIRSFAEDKRRVMTLAQEPETADDPLPLTVEDWNDTQMMIWMLLRRLGSWGSRSGATATDVFRLSFNASGGTFNINGSGSNGDDSPTYFVHGIPCFLPGTTHWAAQADPLSAWVHGRSTGLTVDTLTDTALKLVPGAAVGKHIVPKISDTGGGGGTPRAFTVVANGEDWIRCDVSGGTHLTDVATEGDRWRFALTTPGSDRTDVVYLDAYVDEAAATAVPGDRNNDADLNQDDGGFTFEPTRRGFIVQRVFVDEGGVMLAPDILLAGDGVYTYVDSDSNTHYMVKLAEFDRTSIETHLPNYQIRDKRVYAGRLSIESIHRQVAAIVPGGVLSSGALAPSVASPTVTIAGGDLAIGGDVVTFPTTAWSQDPNTGSAWVNATKYAVYVDTDRCLKIKSGDTFPAGVFKIAVCLGGSAGALSLLADVRASAVDVLALFDPSPSGVLQSRIRFLLNDANPYKTTAGILQWLALDGSTQAQIHADSTQLTAVALNNLAGIFGSTGGQLKFRKAADNLIELFAGVDDTTVLDMMVSGAKVKAARTQEMRTKRSVTARTVPCLASDVNTPVPYVSTWVFPASRGNLSNVLDRCDAIPTSDEVGAVFAAHHHTFIRTRNILPWDVYYDGVLFRLNSDSLVPQISGTFDSRPVYWIELPVPRGCKITSFVLHFRDLLDSGAALTLEARLYNRTSIGSGAFEPAELVNSPHPTGYPFTVSCAGGTSSGAWRTKEFKCGPVADPTNYFSWSDDQYNVDSKTIGMALFLNNMTGVWTRASDTTNRFVIFAGGSAQVEIQGVGAPDATPASASAFWWPGA